MAIQTEGFEAAADDRPNRRHCLRLLALASLLPVLSACSAGCSSKGGADGAACRQRQNERATVRDRNRGWGR